MIGERCRFAEIALATDVDQVDESNRLQFAFPSYFN